MALKDRFKVVTCHTITTRYTSYNIIFWSMYDSFWKVGKHILSGYSWSIIHVQDNIGLYVGCLATISFFGQQDLLSVIFLWCTQAQKKLVKER